MFRSETRTGPVSQSASSRQVGGDHYKNMGIEPWDVIDSWPIDLAKGFYRGSALKYLMRAGSKGDMLDDVRKAHHCLEKLIETLSQGGHDA